MRSAVEVAAYFEVRNDMHRDVCTGLMLDRSLYMPHGTSKLIAYRECCQSSDHGYSRFPQSILGVCKFFLLIWETLESFDHNGATF